VNPPAAEIARARLPDWLFSAAAALACLLDAFAPWMRSGTVDRDGYQLLASGQRAGLLVGSGARTLSLTAYLLPSLAAATLAAVYLGRPAAGRTLAGVTGAVLVTGSALATTRLHAGLLFGPFLGLALGGLTIVIAAARTMTTRSQR
jgi:hypothetical protein